MGGVYAGSCYGNVLRRFMTCLGEKMSDTTESLRETERLLKEVGRKISAIGEKFGVSFEGSAWSSLCEVLAERFHINYISPRVLARSNGNYLELDVMAYSLNDVYVVEREGDLEKIQNILRQFREFFPEHRDKRVYGILAAVDIPEDLRQRVLRSGIYLARIHDEVFDLEVPDGFQPRSF